MTERPILFSAEMVRAILKCRKTQTRRVMKVQPWPDATVEVGPYHPHWVDRNGESQPGPATFGAIWNHQDIVNGGDAGLRCPYGAPGDLLWVRETFCAHWGAPPHDAPQSYRIVTGDELPPIKQENGDFYHPSLSDIMTVWYGAEGDKPFYMAWRPPIHMPRWASRLTLRITDIRVERLQDISVADARAEGCESPLIGAEAPTAVPGVFLADERTTFASLWNKINGPGAWGANPWVWAISFKRVKP